MKVFNVNPLHLNLPNDYIEIRKCSDGSVQLYFYDSKKIEIQYDFSKYNPTQELTIIPTIKGRNIQIVCVVIKTSENWFSLTTLYKDKTVTVSAKGYTGLNAELNKVYANFLVKDCYEKF
ncbi:MAG: hypothetical protein IJ301_04355 [Clostridia bacterium]|nr:hypothetical protein [Clostridia bacterium]